MNCDWSAFEDAFLSRKLVRFLIATKGCSSEEAEEISQLAWLKAWKNREQFRNESSLLTWVTHIALNILWDRVRAPRRTYVDESALAFVGFSERHDAKIYVQQLLALMDPVTRDVLTKRYLDGQIDAFPKVTVFRAVRKARRQIERANLIAKARQAAA